MSPGFSPRPPASGSSLLNALSLSLSQVFCLFCFLEYELASVGHRAGFLLFFFPQPQGKDGFFLRDPGKSQEKTILRGTEIVKRISNNFIISQTLSPLDIFKSGLWGFQLHSLCFLVTGLFLWNYIEKKTHTKHPLSYQVNTITAIILGVSFFSESQICLCQV